MDLTSLYDIFGNFASFLNEFLTFMSTSVNDYFSVDIPVIGDITGAGVFLGSGIALVLVSWLISLVWPS